jgi:hypothetical protein
MNYTLMILGAILLVVFLVAIGPLALIWAWNTLFGVFHPIPYTFWTWLASAIIMAVLAPNVRITKK